MKFMNFFNIMLIFVLFSINIPSVNAESDDISSFSTQNYYQKWSYSFPNDSVLDILEANNDGAVLYSLSSVSGESYPFEIGMLSSNGKRKWKKNYLFYDYRINKKNIIAFILTTDNKEGFAIIRKSDGKLLKFFSVKQLGFKTLRPKGNNDSIIFEIDEKDNIFLGFSDKLYKINSQGKKVWEYKFSLPANVSWLSSNIENIILLPNNQLLTWERCMGEMCYYFNDQLNVISLSAETGKELWKTNEEIVASCAGVGCNVALLYKDLIILENTIDSKIIALNKKDGTVVWKKNYNDDYIHGFSSVQNDDDSKFYVDAVTDDGQGGAIYKYIEAVDKETGKTIWKSKAIDKTYALQGMSRDKKILYIAGEKGTYHLNSSNGKLLRFIPYKRNSFYSAKNYTEMPTLETYKFNSLATDAYYQKEVKPFGTIWNIRHTVYSSNGKKIGSVSYISRGISNVLINDKAAIFVWGIRSIKVFYPKK